MDIYLALHGKTVSGLASFLHFGILTIVLLTWQFLADFNVNNRLLPLRSKVVPSNESETALRTYYCTGSLTMYLLVWTDCGMAKKILWPVSVQLPVDLRIMFFCVSCFHLHIMFLYVYRVLTCIAYIVFVYCVCPNIPPYSGHQNHHICQALTIDMTTQHDRLMYVTQGTWLKSLQESLSVTSASTIHVTTCYCKWWLRWPCKMTLHVKTPLQLIMSSRARK